MPIDLHNDSLHSKYGWWGLPQNARKGTCNHKLVHYMDEMHQQRFNSKILRFFARLRPSRRPHCFSSHGVDETNTSRETSIPSSSGISTL